MAKRSGPYSAHVRSAWTMPLGLAVLVCLALLAIGAYARDALLWIDHTDQVIAKAQLVELRLTDASAAKRAFLLAPSAELRTAFAAAAGRVPVELRSLEALVADNPPQVHKVRDIERLAEAWLQDSARMVESPLAERAGGLRLEDMAQLRAEMSKFVEVEVGLRDRRSRHARHATGAATLGTVALVLLLALGLAVTSRRALRRLAHEYEGMLSALQAERTRFRAMFEQAAVGMAQVSLDGRWVAVNQRLADITGRTREQMLGMSFQEITHRDDLGRDLDLARRVVAGELPAYEMEKRYLRKDGSSVWVNLTAALVRRDDGSPDYFISVVQDISARVAAEAELRRLNAELEERVEQRTEALSAVNAELETFSYSVSHDLRAPLRSIDGFSQALVEDVGDKLDAEARDHLRRIRRATARMAELIDDLLQLSRLSRVDLRRDRVDASGLARTILDELRQREPGRKVDVQVQPGLVVAADPKLVRILFENLLGNAWKFTRRSAHPRIEVLSSDGELGVRDNGAGFDMAYADQLFKPFHRLHRSDQFEGSGIGLATVRRIVHRHGGHIRAESEPGRGATFWFTLLPEPRGAVARTVVAHRDSRTSA